MARELHDHPEVAWALRTGYPSWMQPKRDLDVDDYEEEDDDLDGYSNEE